MKLLTVTVPCYNSAGYMSKCIDSLLVGGERMEIVIIDDGSKDETGAIADQYAARYPTIVKVVHQPNGGHGEGINQGLANATGEYFRVVDSDDWLDADALKALLAKMEELEPTGGADLFVTNYVYTHDDPELDNTIEYRHEFRNGKAIKWNQTRTFRLDTYLTLHSCTFRTETIRKSGIVLPKHTFYEDNMFVYAPLPYVDTLCYLDVDLYRYFIGREGQSVQGDVFARRYAQQVFISKEVFKMYDFDKEIARNKKRGKYMFHAVRMLMSIATAGARLNGSEQAEADNKAMWKECIEANPKYGKKLRYRSPIAFQSIPGKTGRKIANSLYRITRKLVKN